MTNEELIEKGFKPEQLTGESPMALVQPFMKKPTMLSDELSAMLVKEANQHFGTGKQAEGRIIEFLGQVRDVLVNARNSHYDASEEQSPI